MWMNAGAALCAIVVFLLGLKVMRIGLDGMAAGKLPRVIKRFVRTPTRGVLTGTVVTSLTQSSSAVTAICVGMVASQTITFQDAIGIVLGANVGSTITPQILTLNLWQFMIPCLLIGSVGLFVQKPQVRNPSLALVGFSAIYIAVQVFSTASAPFAEEDWCEHILLIAGQIPWLAAALGCILSAVFQSSTAITVMTMTFAAEGLLPLPGGIAVVLGANVGTCLTSIVAAVGQRREAQQVALAHVVLNVVGLAIAMPFLEPFAQLIRLIESDPSRQIADAHTLFNIISTLVFWPLVYPYAKFIQWLRPATRST